MVKEITFETEICKNRDEDSFEDEFGIASYDCSHLFAVEGCKKNSRKVLDEDAISEIKQEFIDFKNKYQDKVVIGIFQTKKGIVKSWEQVVNQTKCNMFDGSDGVCIYETSPQQSSMSFSSELNSMLDLTEEFSRYMVFEMESENLREKTEISLSAGIRNFVLIAGNYADNDLWIDLVDRIRAEEGKVAIVLPARMHRVTKKSYMEQAISSGANFVCHGVFSGGSSSSKERVHRFLDCIDMVYKEINLLPSENVLMSDSQFSGLISTERNDTKKYHLGRVSALREGSVYSESHKRTIVLSE